MTPAVPGPLARSMDTAPGQAPAARVLLAVRSASECADLSYQLLAAGHRVSTALTLAEAVRLIESDIPRLWLLDGRLLPPQDSPPAPAGSLRRMAKGSALILYFPDGASPATRVDAFQRGADSVLVGPLDPRELLLNVEAIMRRTPLSSTGPARHRMLVIDEAAHEVRVDDRPVRATPIEFSLLHLMVRHSGRLLSHEALKAAAWGHPTAATDHALREHVSRLRAKLGSAGSCIETVRGTGFRFRWPETPTSDSRDALVARRPEDGDG